MAAETHGVVFAASFPSGGTPIRIGPDSMTIVLEIPRTELDKGLALVALQEMALKVTIAPLSKEEFAAMRKQAREQEADGAGVPDDR